MKFWKFNPLENKKDAMMFNVVGFYFMIMIAMMFIINWLNYKGWWSLPLSSLYMLLAYIHWICYYESKEKYLESVVDGI